MRIVIIASGSRGDVQPYIALGKGLHEAGHTVRLLTHSNFRAMVVACGLEFWPMRGNVQEVAESEEMRALLEKGNFIAISRYTAQAAQGAAIQWAEDGLAACQGMEMLVAGLGGLFLGISLAEKLGLPLLQAYYVPFTPTKAFPGALLPESTPKSGRLVQPADASHDPRDHVAGVTLCRHTGPRAGAWSASRIVLGTVWFRMPARPAGTLRLQPVGDPRAARLGR